MATGTKPAELRTLTDDELVEKLREAKAELFNLRFQAATGQLESHGRIRTVKRDIARLVIGLGLVAALWLVGERYINHFV